MLIRNKEDGMRKVLRIAGILMSITVISGLISCLFNNSLPSSVRKVIAVGDALANPTDAAPTMGGEGEGEE